MANKRRVPIHPQTELGQALERDMNRSWQRHYNSNALLEEFDDRLKKHTITMAELGVSYRKKDYFQVGATIVAMVAKQQYNPNRPNSRQGTGIVVLEGYNMSHFKGVTKDCAEGRAFRMGDEEIIGPRIERGIYRLLHDPLRPWKNLRLTVASNGKPEVNKEINNLDAPTLHCCMTPCQDELEDHPSSSEDLPIKFIRFDRETRQILDEEDYTLRALREMYANIEPPSVSAQETQQKTKQ